MITVIAHYQDIEDPDHFVLYEQYDDEAAFQAHRATPHFTTYIERRVIPLLQERSWSRYDEITPAHP